MTCQELVEFLMQYLDGELPEHQRAAFEEHLGVCPPCVHYLHTYREAVRVGRMVCKCPHGPVPEDVPEDLVQAILIARARQA
jgi:anti-sigma factor RsiW